MHYKTDCVSVVGGYACAYCGEEMKYGQEIEDYRQYEYYECDCEGAKLELKKQEIEEQLAKIKKHTYEKVIKRKKYERELFDLQWKYEIREDG